MAAKSTRVDVVFKKGLNIFGGDVELANPVLTILIDPKGGIEFKINAKDVTSEFLTRVVNLNWTVSDEDKKLTPEPYERMIHDAMDGNGSNFADWNGVAIAWKFVDAIQEAWDATREQFLTMFQVQWDQKHQTICWPRMATNGSSRANSLKMDFVTAQLAFVS